MENRRTRVTHPSREVLSVGGSEGIRIDGNDVYIAGAAIGRESAPMQAALVHPRQMPPQMTHVADSLKHGSLFLVRHLAAVGIGLLVAAAVLLIGGAVVIAVLQLPWFLLAVPGTVAALLLTVALAVIFQARKRITTGGVDPDVERRILDVAMMCNGRVTPTAIAHALAMPIAAADATLTMLARTGHVTVDNDPASGVLVYVFPDIEAGLVRLSRDSPARSHRE